MQLAVSDVGSDGALTVPLDESLMLETSLALANAQLAEANRKLATVRGPFRPPNLACPIRR
jgi:hypothetical protein